MGYNNMKKNELIKLLNEMLKEHTRQGGTLTNKGKQISIIIKAVKRLPFEDFNIKALPNKHIPLGYLLEFVTAWNVFGLKNYTTDNNVYDLHLNGAFYEFKSVALNSSTAVKRVVDYLIVTQVTTTKIEYYKIPLKDNTSLVGERITSQLLKHFKDYKL